MLRETVPARGRVRLAAGCALHGSWLDDAVDVGRAAGRALHTLPGPCAGLVAVDAAFRRLAARLPALPPPGTAVTGVESAGVPQAPPPPAGSPAPAPSP